MSDLEDFIREKIEEITADGDDLAHRVESYFDEATAINTRKIASSERTLSLDEIPFGEECLRLDGQAEGLRGLMRELTTLDVNKLQVGEVEEKLSEARDAIDGLSATLDECTSLPDDEDEDEDEDDEF